MHRLSRGVFNMLLHPNEHTGAWGLSSGQLHSFTFFLVLCGSNGFDVVAVCSPDFFCAWARLAQMAVTGCLLFIVTPDREISAVCSLVWAERSISPRVSLVRGI